MKRIRILAAVTQVLFCLGHATLFAAPNFWDAIPLSGIVFLVACPPQAAKLPPMKPLLLALSLLLPLAALHAQDKEKKPEVLPAKDAKSKVGETVTIEAKVAEVNKTEKIVRINLEARFPKQELTLVIFSSNFSKFEDVEKLEGKTVRVTGKVTEYQKRPQIVLDAKEQLKVVETAEEKK